MIMVETVLKNRTDQCPGTLSNVLEFLSQKEHKPCLASLTSWEIEWKWEKAWSVFSENLSSALVQVQFWNSRFKPEGREWLQANIPCMFVYAAFLKYRSFTRCIWHCLTYMERCLHLFFLFLAAMLGTQLNDLVTSNQIDVKAVVQLDKYVCNTIQETR